MAEEMRLVNIAPLLKELREEAGDCGEQPCEPASLSDAIYDEIDDLEGLPVIDPETLRPVASWVKGEDIMSEYYACSRCEHKVRDRFGTSSYCPHCGAKMEGFKND